MNKANIAKWLVGAGLSASVALSGGYLIAPKEGEVVDKATGLHTVYKDSVGVPTACWGQTGYDLYNRRIKLGMTYTEKECLIMLENTLRSFKKQVDALVFVPYASPYEEASTLSFAYNVGVNNFKNSTLRKYLNNGQHTQACDEYLRWVYADGKKLKGLENRREEERQWCLGNVKQDIVVTFNDITKMVVKDYTKDASPKK